MISQTDPDFICRDWAFQRPSLIIVNHNYGLILLNFVWSWTCVLSISIKFPEFLVCLWVVGYLFRVIRTVIFLSFDIVSCVFPLLEIRFPVDVPGWVGLRRDCSHCLTSDKLFKFALFHELYLNVVTSLRQRRAESCRHFCRIYNPARITYVRNIWLSFR